MLNLRAHRRAVPFLSSRQFFRPWMHIDAAVSPVVTHMVNRGFSHSGVVNVVYDFDVHPIDRRVVVETPVVPPAAFIAMSEVSETVVDPAVETHFGTPVPREEDESVVFPAPIARRPQESDFRSQYPRARYPVVVAVVIVVSPVSRRPDISVTGANGLFVDG